MVVLNKVLLFAVDIKKYTHPPPWCRSGHIHLVKMGYTLEQLNAAKGLQASFGATKPPRPRGRKSSDSARRASSNFVSSSSSYNRAGRSGSNISVSGSYRTGSASANGPCHRFAPASGLGSTTSSIAPHQRGGSSFPAGSSNIQPNHSSDYNLYDSPGTPRAPRPVPATSLSNVPSRGPYSSTGPNEAAAIGARIEVGSSSKSQQPDYPSSTSTTERRNNPHGGLASSRYADATTGLSSTTVSSSSQPSGVSHVNVVTGASSHTEQVTRSSTATHALRHGGATSNVPSSSQPSGGNIVSVATNGHASQDHHYGGQGTSRYSNDTDNTSPAAILIKMCSLRLFLRLCSLAINSPLPLPMDLASVSPSNESTGRSSSSHARGKSNTSDVVMVDLDGQTEGGIKPLRLHGGMHDSRWANGALAAHVSDPNGPSTDPSHGSVVAPSGSTLPNTSMPWRTSTTWSLPRFRNTTSTSTGQLAQSGTQPSREPTPQSGLHQSTSGASSHGGLGASCHA
ncbi:hypothetical protein PG999_006373 [Apiospora kogelbergensis]|uniref:Uncharacterized protein n=1 Tax=Apiospora kogelbergensis TaxID=1337665 RepID=A0AAW0QSD1_9PEZI